jgi:hypothetical protein
MADTVNMNAPLYGYSCPSNSRANFRNTLATHMCVFYLLSVDAGERRRLSHASQFTLSLPSVSGVENYLNVWSGYITFSLRQTSSVVYMKDMIRLQKSTGFK